MFQAKGFHKISALKYMRSALFSMTGCSGSGSRHVLGDVTESAQKNHRSSGNERADRLFGVI